MDEYRKTKIASAAGSYPNSLMVVSKFRMSCLPVTSFQIIVFIFAACDERYFHPPKMQASEYSKIRPV